MAALGCFRRSAFVFWMQKGASYPELMEVKPWYDWKRSVGAAFTLGYAKTLVSMSVFP
jgi:hypothetical protein